MAKTFTFCLCHIKDKDALEFPWSVSSLTQIYLDSLFPQLSAFVLPGFLFALLANGLLVIIFSFAPQFGAVQFSLEICAKHEPTFVFTFSYCSVPNCSVSYFSVPYCCFCVSALPHEAELAGSKCYASVATKVTPPAFVCFLVCYLYICFFDV